MLTIAYLTCRKEPKFEWFRDSLLRQSTEENFQPDRVVVVDHWQSTRAGQFSYPKAETVHVAPKPNVWSGPHKLTTREYFSAANTRNTALCLAPDGHLVYVDDLSVLMPGWLRAVRECVEYNTRVSCGSYLKANKIVVENGMAISWETVSKDSRWNHATSDKHSCSGSWMYGCSICLPVQALLDINGWDENCDGMGYEDVFTGTRLGNLGRYSFLYDRTMMTVESEEHHHDPTGGDFKRLDKGVSPRDKSHAMLNMASSSAWCPNYFGAGGIAEVRRKVLAGEPFPMQQIPQHDWFDGQPLSEM